MNPRGMDPLLVASKVVTLILQGAVGLGAAALAVSLPIVTVFKGDIVRGFADGAALPVEDLPLAPTVALLVLLFLVLAAMFVFFGKLRQIIDTVGEGDPFVPANAERLSRMAWLMLGVQVLLWPAAYCASVLADWANKVDGVDLHVQGDGFDLTGILILLLLFVLARVFRVGAAMREDLEGTV
ncbi:DUF2975 domain-containing protein [Erythrobacter sp. NE805]|uniref:DUF2975 domain-containing protein n=1 Tax=Erythrobacter sp. NE805 TaxID=3389875 RepID=UPI00396B0AD7